MLTDSDIDGDASFSMTLTELSTAAQFNIGVKILILNNEEQGDTIYSVIIVYLKAPQLTDIRRHGHAMAIAFLRGQICAHSPK